MNYLTIDRISMILFFGLAFLVACNLSAEEIPNSLRYIHLGAKEEPNTEQNKIVVQNDITVSFYLVNSEVEVRGPVIIDFVVKNNTSETAKIDLGEDREAGFDFALILPEGKRILLSRRPTEGISRRGDVSIGPQQTYSQRLIVNEWFRFSIPGKYVLEAKLENPVETEGGRVIAANTSSTIEFNMKPANQESLRRTAAFLAQKVIESRSYQQAVDAATALSHVEDPVAVPYLRKGLVSYKMVAPIIIDGLVRIASKESVHTLVTLYKEQAMTEVGDLAKSALEKMEKEDLDLELKQMISKTLHP